MIVPLILSGGKGSRLKPLSTEDRPKQFLNLISKDKSLLQETITRVSPLSKKSIVIGNIRHKSLFEEQISGVTILYEPCGRNTAPAIAIAALYIVQNFRNATMLVLPADHSIKNTQAFLNTVSEKKTEDHLVMFGVKPESPETDYGYIKYKNNKVLEFIEKPDITTAGKYVSSGEYLWNSGIFLFSPLLYLSELKKYQPDVLEKCTAALSGDKIDEKIFSTCPSISIDCAVMEKTTKSVVFPLDCGWSDVGSWDRIKIPIVV